MPGRHILVVLAHPLPQSFTASAARIVVETLEAAGNTVDLLDLYAEDFDPRLTVAERAAYMEPGYDTASVAPLVRRLQAADGLVLVFPQWWFNLPAIMKGFIDRVFVPGVAFSHDKAGGRIVPLLANIKTFWIVTSTGSPWWVVHLYMGNPLRRLMKRGVAAFCARKLDFRMVTLHDMDRADDARRREFLQRLRHALARF